VTLAVDRVPGRDEDEGDNGNAEHRPAAVGSRSVRRLTVRLARCLAHDD
jgi:hypothetical protein